MDTSDHSARDDAFDAVKGALVLLMVAYHVMSIASTGGVEAFRYIRFISGSFIFVSGFVMTRFMAAAFSRDPGRVSRRLVGRGLKVLMIFTLLNLAIQVSGFGNLSKARLGFDGWWANAATIYLAGDGRLSSFMILLPIAYLLIASPLVLQATRAGRARAALALLTVALTASALPAIAGRWPVVDFLLVGLAGLALGTPSISGRLLARTPVNAPITLAGLAAAVWAAGLVSDPLFWYVVGVAVVLRFLHDLARLLPPYGLISRYAVLLGQYALLAYIGQIVIIQLLYRAAGGQRLDLGAGVLSMGAAAGALLVGLCLAVQRLRERSSRADRTYRLIFS